MSQIEVTIAIGERQFEVACQEGEEQFLQAAAKMLDDEAQVLVSSIGRMPESRMLLMSGLMLADKTISLEDRLKQAQDTIAGLSEEIESLKSQPAPEPETVEVQVEVPVIPDSVTENLAALTARAEALAEIIAQKTQDQEIDPDVTS